VSAVRVPDPASRRSITPATNAARAEPRPARPTRPASRARPTTPPERGARRARTRARRWAFLLVSLVTVGGLLVATVATQALVNQTSFKMQELQARARQARQTVVQLQLQVADLSSPDRIVAEARALGLRLPDGKDVKVLPVRARGASSLTGPRGPSAGAGDPGQGR
jgi:cell division protein FtsL